MKWDQIKKQYPLFFKWAEEKKLSEKEIRILKQLSEKESLPLLSWIAEYRPSYSQGVEILELSGELLLMGQLPLDIFQNSKEPATLLQKLKKLRYPLSVGKEEERSEYLKKLPWPRGLKGKWIRWNDKSGLHIHFQAFSFRELSEKIKAMETLYKQLKKSRKFWKN